MAMYGEAIRSGNCAMMLLFFLADATAAQFSFHPNNH
jgi:hypothetical protein